ncbi:MAG: type III pantothenate kinase [Nitrospinaceae bacterium]
MLLAVDIGNTNIVCGLFQEAKLLVHWRIQTERHRTADEYWVLVQEFIRQTSADPSPIDAVIISCVVPPLVPVFQELSRKFFRTEALVVGPGIRTGISILYKNPQEVGADRIVNAVAGFEKYGGPLILVDFGTATTFDAVSAKGEYLGGAIAPGVRISLEALFRNTAKLAPVDLAAPSRVIGRSTMESIQSGAVFGFAGMIEHIVSGMQKELEAKARVVGTGGLIHVIADKAPVIDTVDEFLTLDGLLILYEKNRKS